MSKSTFTVTEHVEPDHPWNENNQVAGYCLTCGSPQVIHDGNLDRVFDWMERLGRIADGHISNKESAVAEARRQR